MKKQTLVQLLLLISISTNIYLVHRLVPGELKIAVNTLTSGGTENYLAADLIALSDLFVAWHRVEDEPGVKQEVNFCTYEKPEKETYSGKLVTIKKPDRVEPGEVFKVKIYVENTGTTRWFSDTAGCEGEKTIRLGTINPENHVSRFWTDYKDGYNGWLQNEHKNRLELLQHYLDPGQLGTFIFWAKAPDEPDLYRDVFALRLNEEKWVDEPKIAFDVEVGQVTEEMRHKMNIVLMEARSKEIEGEKSIEVDLSEQHMYLKMGEKVIRQFPVSTGQPVKTPTPKGNYKILFKQPSRTGGKWPHYIMDHWQSFRPDGYGLHALPKLGNDGGVFWKEALDHIGRPVSHGCIRLLPWDAEALYGWTEVGIKMVVRQ